MRSTCSVYVIWYHFVPEPSTLFSQVPWSMLWPITSNPNLRVLKIEKWKINQKKNKIRKKIKKELSSYSSILTLNLKGRNFLELLDIDQNSIKLSTIKGSPWLQHFGHSNSLYTRATRAIINYTSIGKYWLRFFSRKEFSFPFSLYPIESRQHILYNCKKFNNYWNSRRDTIAHFSLFLELNSNAFSFG